MLKLGGLIAALERAPQEKPVYFDVLNLAPTTFASYRGYYDDLALGFSGDYSASAPTVAQLLEQCKAAKKETFQGWKGGDYRMDDRSTVWVANRGNTTGYQIERLLWSEDNWCARLVIVNVED